MPSPSAVLLEASPGAFPLLCAVQETSLAMKISFPFFFPHNPPIPPGQQAGAGFFPPCGPPIPKFTRALLRRSLRTDHFLHLLGIGK